MERPCILRSPMRSLRYFRRTAVALGVVAASSGSALAVTRSWIGGAQPPGNGNPISWNVAGNWLGSNGPNPAGGDAVDISQTTFPRLGLNSTAVTPQSNYTIQYLKLNTSAFSSLEAHAQTTATSRTLTITGNAFGTSLISLDQLPTTGIAAVGEQLAYGQLTLSFTTS